MPLEAQWKRHIGKVSATLDLLCRDIPSQTITETLGIEPTFAQTVHLPAVFSVSGIQGELDSTWWGYNSSSRVSSSELNDHLRHVIALILPIQSRIEELTPRVFIRVRVEWESTMAGITGPQIDADCLKALGNLGASLEIYVSKIDEIKET